MAVALAGTWTAAQGSSVTSLTLAARTSTAGNLVVVEWTVDKIADPTSVTDSFTNGPGGVYTKAVSKSNGTGAFNFNTGQHYCPNVTGGASHTVTLNIGSTQFCALGAREYSGAATSGALSGTPVSAVGTVAAANPGALNPPDANCLYVSTCSHDSSGSLTAAANTGAGWALRTNLGDAAGAKDPLFSSDLVASGSQTGTITLSGTSHWAATCAAYAPAAGDTLMAQACF